MGSFFSKLFKTDSAPITGKTFIVDSFSGRDQYRISIDSISCTCPDFLDRRSSFGKNDPRRLCKHLIQVLLETGEIPVQLDNYNDEIQRCGDYRRGFSLDELIRADIAGMNIEISIPPDSTWVNIFLGGTRYGYNHEEMRWSYGNVPEHAPEIEKWIMGRLGKSLPEPIAEGSIKTISKIYIDDRSFVVTGLADEVAISVFINPRAHWMPYTINQVHQGTLNVKSLDNRAPSKYGHLEQALKRWITDQLPKSKRQKEDIASQEGEKS
jgi:hypothetical protein